MGIADPVMRRVARLRAAPTPLQKRVALRTAALWDPVHVWWYRRRRGYTGPVPRLANRRRVGAWPAPAFIEGGRQARDALADRIVQRSGRPLGELTALDFGCGAGRIAIHFEGQFARFFVTDVDATAIAYLQEALPPLNASCNRPEPPLPFPDALFDVVYAWSIWTHLNLDLQRRWLEELHRVLKPGGLALLTVNGHVWLDAYQQGPHADDFWRRVSHDDLRTKGMIYAEYEPTGEALPGITGPYGLTFHDPEHIRREWSSLFVVEAVEEGAMHNHQDLVTLRRRP